MECPRPVDNVVCRKPCLVTTEERQKFTSPTTGRFMLHGTVGSIPDFVDEFVEKRRTAEKAILRRPQDRCVSQGSFGSEQFGNDRSQLRSRKQMQSGTTCAKQGSGKSDRGQDMHKPTPLRETPSELRSQCSSGRCSWHDDQDRPPGVRALLNEIDQRRPMLQPMPTGGCGTTRWRRAIGTFVFRGHGQDRTGPPTTVRLSK